MDAVAMDRPDSLRAFWSLSRLEALAIEYHTPYWVLDASTGQGTFICNTHGCPEDVPYRQHIREMSKKMRKDAPPPGGKFKHQQDRDINTLSVWAVRYALGRMTYAVSDVTEVIARNKADITTGNIDVIIRDITEAEEKSGLGMGQDASRWIDLRALLAEEVSNRPKYW